MTQIPRDFLLVEAGRFRLRAAGRLALVVVLVLVAALLLAGAMLW